MLALASDFARQVLVVDRQVSLLAMLALVVTPVVYVRMHWLALEVPMCTCIARMSAQNRNSGHALVGAHWSANSVRSSPWQVIAAVSSMRYAPPGFAFWVGFSAFWA